MGASCVAVAGLTLSSAGGVSAQNGPPVAMLDHVPLYVQDLERTARFYCEVFHLAPVEAPVPRTRWLVLAHGTTLHLVEGRTAPVANERWDHFAIAWSEIQGRPEPQTRPDGVRQIFVQDPDGYWIEINDALRPHD